MKFSFSIPTTTVFVLLCTVLINIAGLKWSLETHFPLYIDSIQNRLENDVSLDPKGIQALFSVKNLDPETQTDYQAAIDELARISSSLQSLSENPELYVENEANIVGVSGRNAPSANAFQIYADETILQEYNKNLLSFFTDPFGFKEGSAEQEFIVAILINFLIINTVWFALVMLLYILWIRRLLRPIYAIIETIKDIPHTRETRIFSYQKNDEFRPLIEALNALQQSLKKQETIRNNFLSDLSHEIRTPITAISCTLEAIEDGVMTLDAINIMTLQNEMNRLIKITSTIMEHENFLNSISEAPKKEHIPIAAMTQEIARQYEFGHQKSEQRILVSMKSDHTLWVNAEHYIQILHNIFSNFYKYAGEGSTLKCLYKKTKKHTILTFQDDGVGVSESDITMIREKFFRSDTGRHQDVDNVSMGLGLSILDRILSLHNATMQIRHSDPNGLTLILTFPNYDA